MLTVTTPRAPPPVWRAGRPECFLRSDGKTIESEGAEPRMLLSAAAGRAGNEEHAADNRYRAEDRRDRHRLLLVGGRLDRAEVHDLLLAGEGEAAGGEAGDPEYDQNDPDEGPQPHTALRP